MPYTELFVSTNNLKMESNYFCPSSLLEVKKEEAPFKQADMELNIFKKNVPTD